MKGESDSDRKGKRKGQRMTFEQAMHDTCRELGYDGHLKTIKYKKECYTYAEKIVSAYKKTPYTVKNSYMYLDGVDFCFYQNENG